MEVMSRVEENRISGRLAESNPKSSDPHLSPHKFKEQHK